MKQTDVEIVSSGIASVLQRLSFQHGEVLSASRRVITTIQAGEEVPAADVIICLSFMARQAQLISSMCQIWEKYWQPEKDDDDREQMQEAGIGELALLIDETFGT